MSWPLFAPSGQEIMEGLQEYEFNVIIVNQYSGALTLCKALRYTTELLISRNINGWEPTQKPQYLHWDQDPPKSQKAPVQDTLH